MKVSALLLVAAAVPAAAVGSVKDEHGCIPSAGYSWCESSQKCLRPWEEGCTDSTEADADPVVVGGDADDTTTCLASAGYNFCPELKKCVRAWETNDAGVSYEDLCPTMMKNLLDDGSLRGRRASLLGSLKDDNGCIPSAGYTWCESSQKCVRPWEEGCADTVEADTVDDDDDSATDDATADSTDDTTLLSGDTDSAGCLASAGYTFCPELKKCVRYWETDDNGVSYEDQCPSMMKALDAEDTGRRVLQLGGTKDEHGCYVSAGYQWCDSTNACVRLWEQGCPGIDYVQTTTTKAPPSVGGDQDANGCCVSCGYQWCDEQSECVRPWMVDLAKQCPTLAAKLEDELKTP